MKLTNAEKLALELMNKHGLIKRGWVFRFSRAKRRFGLCNHYSRRISMSKYLIPLNSEAEVKDTILHEIAHALVGPDQGHNEVWKAKCREIGAIPERCYGENIQTPETRYKYKCPNGHIMKRNRRPKYHGRISCTKCCKKYNPKYLFVLYEYNGRKVEGNHAI